MKLLPSKHRKKTVAAIAIILVIVLAYVTILVLLIPTYVTPIGKITNPDDPKFNSLLFRFEDYGEPKYTNWFERCVPIKKIFKRGTSKELVKKMMENANALLLSRHEDINTDKYLNPINNNFIANSLYSLIPEYYSGQAYKIQYDENDNISYVECNILIGSFDYAWIKRKLEK